MFRVDGEKKTIELSKGDTGAIRFRVTAKMRETGDVYNFSERDRAVFSLKDGSNREVMTRECEIVDNMFTIIFHNADTDKLTPGTFRWDVRYILNPFYSDEGKIVDGDQVITPDLPMTANLLTVVGEI